MKEQFVTRKQKESPRALVVGVVKNDRVMQEQKINFETAKLAKEKGFPQSLSHSQHINLKEDEWKLYSSTDADELDNSIGIGENIRCSAPTQSLLQKWLREVHNIDVVVGSTYLGYNVVLWNRNTYKLHHISPVNIAEKYEDVLEIGLMEALKII